MKRTTISLLIPLFAISPLRAADNGECLETAVYEMNDIHRTGSGCEDGIFNAVSSSMIGWGVGLFVGIALLTGLVHNSHNDSSSSSSSSNDSN